MESLLPVLAVVAVAVLAGLTLWWHFSRSGSLLDQWAERSGYRIVSREYRNVVTGPFFWTSSEGQTVYRVTVEDRQGNRRSGWARCGGFFFGLLSDKVEVRWDD
jgi:hypothetical protein